MTSRLTDAVGIGARQAPSRVVFGPHETNLGWGRAIGVRHAAYYARRAEGGAGVIITETASVTANDWPYERAPLASESTSGWSAVHQACRPHGTVMLAGLGHAGAQGSSAYSQEVMWAPSRVADVVSREPPAELDAAGISSIVAAFAQAAIGAVTAGMDGVEIDAGAWSLLRQFHSGLTNLRSDDYGQDRLKFTTQVLTAVRSAIGTDRILALRLSCDELAPWAGVTPEHAAVMVASLAGRVDLLTVVRGGPYSSGAYRPDAHTPPAFNTALCAQMRSAASGAVPVVLQGSVVDLQDAEEALAGEVCDLVEMTRAQIADARLVTQLRSGLGDRIRPCILCNQACRVRDNRNPIISCVVDPSAGRETEEPGEPRPGGGEATGSPVLVIGSGPAGLEAARILAAAGRRVRVAERSARPGGVPVVAARGPGRERLRRASDWLVDECTRLGVEFSLGHEVDATEVAAARADGWDVVMATGSRPVTDRRAVNDPPYVGPPYVVDALGVLAGGAAGLPPGPVVIDDPTGDQVAVGVAEWLAAEGRTVTLVSPDPVVGTLLARTGDLADANVRLQRAGVHRQLRSLIKKMADGYVEVEDAWTGAPARLEAAAVVDCGHRLPEDGLYRRVGDRTIPRVGDCVAPRTILEAVLEGRRAAAGLLAAPAQLAGAGS